MIGLLLQRVAINPAARAGGFSTATVRERSGSDEDLRSRGGRWACAWRCSPL